MRHGKLLGKAWSVGRRYRWRAGCGCVLPRAARFVQPPFQASWVAGVRSRGRPGLSLFETTQEPGPRHFGLHSGRWVIARADSRPLPQLGSSVRGRAPSNYFP